MKTKSRIICYIMSLVLILTSITWFNPINAYAADEIISASALNTARGSGVAPGTEYVEVKVFTAVCIKEDGSKVYVTIKCLSDESPNTVITEKYPDAKLTDLVLRDKGRLEIEWQGSGREAGLKVYYTEVPVGPRPATLASAANGLCQQIQGGCEPVGTARYISGNHMYVLQQQNMSKSACDLLFSSWQGCTSRAEILQLVATVDPGRVEKVSKALANYDAGITDTLPAYFAVPVISSANGDIDTYAAGVYPIGSDPSIATLVGQALDIAAGDSDMGELMMTGRTIGAAFSSTLMPNGQYIAGSWAILGLGTQPDPLPEEAIIYAYAKPKAQTVKWAKQSVQTGSYTVKVQCTQHQIAYTDGIAHIEITPNFTGSEWNQLTQQVKEVKVEGIPQQYVTSATSSLVKIDVPVAIISDWNAFGQVVFTVDVTGGHDNYTEEKVGALFQAKVTINNQTEQAKPAHWPGMDNIQDVKYTYTRTPNVQEYVSFIGSSNNVETDKPYDKHSVQTPIGRGHLVANAYDENDWDVATGIPSTENVTASVGAEIAMYDIAGYLCVRNNNGASSEGRIDENVGTIDDESGTNIGVEQTSQAVDRLITINSEVVNCWGGSNYPDQLAPATDNTFKGGHSYSYGSGDNMEGDHSCNIGDFTFNGHDGSQVGWNAGQCTNHSPYASWSGCDSGTQSKVSTSGGTPEHDEGQAPNIIHVPDSHDHGHTTTTPRTMNHDCTFNLTVRDAVPGTTICREIVTGLTDSGDETVTLSASNGSSGSSISKGKLWDWTSGQDFGCTVTFRIKWQVSEDRQFYYTEYWISNYSAGSSPVHIGGSHPDYKATGSNGTGNKDAESNSNLHKVVSNFSQPTVISEDYTHGTGSDVTYYENMVNQGTHRYTMIYHETIDAYAYRTITDSQLYSLTGIKLNQLHTIDRPEYKDDLLNIDYDAGTFYAPLEEYNLDKGVSAMDCVGYLFRCCGPNNGEYQDGNGRIEFTAFREMQTKFGENTSVVPESVHEYYLGDVTINLRTVQDSEYYPTIENETTWDASAGDGRTTRGKSIHVNPHNELNSTKYYTTADKTAYTDIETGDCVVHSHTTELFATEHNEAVKKEILVQFNHWCSVNKDEHYKANIISDTEIYGGVEGLSTVITDDAHSVDEGLLLFNITASPTTPSLLNGQPGGGEEQCGETVAYRNHKNKMGIEKLTLINCLEGEEYSDQNVHDGESLPTTDESGGNIATNSTTVGAFYNNALDSASASGGSAGYPVKFTMGDSVTAEGVYNTMLDPLHSKDTPGSGITGVSVEVAGNSSAVFDGSRYWNDHTYKGVGSGIAKVTVHGEIDESSGSNGYSNNGLACHIAYGTLTISNLQLVRWTPNGLWNTGSANAEYIGSNLACNHIPEPADGWEYRDGIAKNHLDISNKVVPAPCGDNAGYFNQIYIFDPVTVENDKVVGCQHGSFAEGVEDQREYDQRVDESGNWVNQASVDDYVVQSRKLYSWLSPIGNFAAANTMHGSNPGCNTSPSGSDAGKVNRGVGNSEHKGYVDNMNCEKWILNETIAYPFIAGVNDMDFASELYIDIPLQLHQYSGGFGPGKSPVPQNVTIGGLLYGNKFAVTDTCNLVEKKNAQIIYKAYGINCFQYAGDSFTSGSCDAGFSFENDHNISKSANGAKKTDDVDLVGSIGNLTIHDTSDFRFSEYFKEIAQPESWLIEGTIKTVNKTLPIKVVSSTKDIMYREAKDLKSVTGELVAHASLGQTLYDDTYRGMAGDFDELPLVPRYNTNENYNKEAMRIGYKVYASVETIGNYQSYIDRTKVTPTGASLTTKDTFPGDTREYYLDIQSVYYLLDLDNNKFYDIDIWSGSSGSKERLYNGTTHKAEPISVAGELFQNVHEEHFRRNVSGLLSYYQDPYAWRNYGDVGDLQNKISPTAKYSDMHYIGNPGHIRLDNRDLYFIGSENNMSLGRAWTQFHSFGSELKNTAQQYHFTEGLTSTSIPTIPLGDNPSQQEIRSANQKIMQEHPHAVILELQNFIAHGTVWTIKLRGSVVNTPTLQIYKVGEVPEGYPATASDPIKYQGANVYDPVTGAFTGTIDPDLSPLVVMEAYSTSADDRQVSGTH